VVWQNEPTVVVVARTARHRNALRAEVDASGPFLTEILAAIVAAGVGGYRIGQQGAAVPSTTATDVQHASAGGSVIYYQDPGGKPFYSAEPKSAPDGRPYRAVHASEDIGFDDAGEAGPKAASAPDDRKILYYRNPMGLSDISKVPKKDPMGMDYIPVYEGEDETGATVKLSRGKLQRIGVKTCCFASLITPSSGPLLMSPSAIWPPSTKANRSRSACAAIRTGFFPALSHWSIRI
jgi:hypothetical protein